MEPKLLFRESANRDLSEVPIGTEQLHTTLKSSWGLFSQDQGPSSRSSTTRIPGLERFCLRVRIGRLARTRLPSRQPSSHFFRFGCRTPVQIHSELRKSYSQLQGLARVSRRINASILVPASPKGRGSRSSTGAGGVEGRGDTLNLRPRELGKRCSRSSRGPRSI